MLVISRKVGEKLLIGDGIAVTVVKITGGGVRLGIDAPPATPVMREELAEEIRLAEEQKAAETRPADADSK
ncbi:MAG: carbon storage regulator [Planctomycetaceae bacterium]|nr:carbon storage regulator [Planctomycetaceae bacterium]